MDSFLFVSRCADRRDLHSFPTRRSSDLARGIVTTGHIDFDVAEAVLRQMRLQRREGVRRIWRSTASDRKSTRLNSSHQINSYAVFCLKKKRGRIMNH